MRFTWEVSDSLSKRKGKVAFCSRIMTCSPLYIAKLPLSPLSSGFDRHKEGYVCDS